MMKYIFLLFLVLALNAQETIGRIDKFDLPEFNISNIKAKLDTGAKTSSLHCSSIMPTGYNKVKFIVMDSKNNSLSNGYVVKDISRVSKVKSSNGKAEKRYFINTKILIYGKVYEIELSLSSRGEMLYPLLIGRELLNKGFVVDVTKKFLSYKKKREREE
ncbi:peptidase [Sulfurimonas aquatica]|uniref:Peptidase n=1 Tax=Sulfurimonas aquatica TaxID=2672570 RepID=A0A975GDQ2_9BACT|nr:RimK/LysX family protein [Sulfurimonas aquatica]QSZ42920.1 peptidase [Sulfurimonas aquatica]